VRRLRRVDDVVKDAPYPYQAEDATWLAVQQFAFVLSEQGTGKTIILIRALDLAGIRDRIVVVAPGLALVNHMREFAKWQTIPRRLQLVRSSQDAQKLHGDVLCISHTLIARVLPQLRAHETFNIVAVDEAQAFKNPSAKRTGALYNSKGLINNTRRMWLFSGTLVLNAVHELWPPYAALLKGKLDYPAFVARYCLTKQTIYGGRTVTQIVGNRTDRFPEIAALFKPHTVRRRLIDVLPELPPLRFVHTTLSPEDIDPPEYSAETRAILGKLERDEALSIKEQMHLTTLLRETSKFKAPAIAEMLQDDLESFEKIVVFAIFRETIDILAEELDDVAVIHGDTPPKNRQQIIDAFQRDEQPRVLIIQLNVGGTAITLHRANYVVFCDVSWTPADLHQAAKRAHRIGQRKSVLARVVSLANSIDEIVVGTITRKAAELALFDTLLEQPA
jgi:SNF2 family DNA or RNA helicase